MNHTLFFRVFVVLSAIIASTCLVSARSLNLEDVSGVHRINKRSFHTLGCLGDYDTAGFSRLDRLCEDCYDMYRDSQVRAMCRSSCFTTDTFKKCAEALLVNMEEEKLGDVVNRLYGRD
uniref:Ion transport peptide n=1 Tax=Strigamia maritima TaxID=126957 RepID=T1JMX7_STRMM